MEDTLKLLFSGPTLVFLLFALNLLQTYVPEAFKYSVGFTAIALIMFGGIKGHFTGINKAKSAAPFWLAGSRLRRLTA